MGLAGAIRYIKTYFRNGIIVVDIIITILFFPKVIASWLSPSLTILIRLLNYSLYWVVDNTTVGVSSLAASAIGGYFDMVRSKINNERKFTKAEYDAFRTFSKDVRSLSVHPQASGGTTTTMFTGRSQTHRSGLDTVRKRYRETVLAVPRFEEVYNERFHEHITAEFGHDLASVVIKDTQFTQSIQTLLVKQANESAKERERYLDILEIEDDSVAEAADRLKQTETVLDDIDIGTIYRYSFDELLSYEQGLGKKIKRCQRVLEDRQKSASDDVTTNIPTVEVWRSSRVSVSTDRYIFFVLSKTFR